MMSKKSILITGGNGQVASALLNHARAGDFKLIACNHHELDICDRTSIEKAIKHHSPDFIVNTAAYTAVDKAENEKQAAMQANQLGAALLATACHQHGMPLIHLSTDYVFDGKKNSAYKEEDRTNPLNVYGESKLAGEDEVKSRLKEHIILRVSAIYSEYGNNFLKTMLRLANTKTSIDVVDDQITCPTYAGDIADVIFEIIENNIPWGTYHFCGSDTLSWHDFASKIIEAARQLMPLTIETINKVSTDDYPSTTKRPLNSVLDCGKLLKLINIQDRSTQRGIKSSLSSHAEVG